MPLNWNEHTDGNTICLETVLDGKTWEEIATQLVDVFAVALERIKTDLTPTSWNRIYLELWADSGRIILYPHKRGKSRSHRALSVDIEISLLQAEHDKIPMDDNDSDVFETHYGALLSKVGLAINEALDNKRVKNLIRKLAEATDFTVWLQDADDQESMGQLYVL